MGYCPAFTAFSARQSGKYGFEKVEGGFVIITLEAVAFHFGMKRCPGVGAYRIMSVCPKFFHILRTSM